MFNVAEKPTFTRTVPIMVPTNDGHREDSIKVTFNVIGTDVAEGFDLSTGKDSADFLRAIVTRIDDVIGADKQPVPYTDELRDQLLQLPYVRIALARCYVENVGKAKSGN